eukprot:scaffold1954_cov268-Pinguiococcus_pyrenoidosus.AAC.307
MEAHVGSLPTVAAHRLVDHTRPARAKGTSESDGRASSQPRPDLCAQSKFRCISKLREDRWRTGLSSNAGKHVVHLLYAVWMQDGQQRSLILHQHCHVVDACDPCPIRAYSFEPRPATARPRHGHGDQRHGCRGVMQQLSGRAQICRVLRPARFGALPYKLGPLLCSSDLTELARPEFLVVDAASKARSPSSRSRALADPSETA